MVLGVALVVRGLLFLFQFCAKFVQIPDQLLFYRLCLTPCCPAFSCRGGCLAQRVKQGKPPKLWSSFGHGFKTPATGAVDLKRFAHSAEPNYLKLFLRSYCGAALLACMLKKLKNCSKVDPKLSPKGPKMTRHLSQNEEKKESGSQNYPREVPGEI